MTPSIASASGALGDGAELATTLEDVREFVARFVYFEKPAQATAITLWIVGTYVFDAYDVTPYLHIKSPEKRSGKSLLLEVLEMLAANPVLAANVSPAALYRVVHLERPTLLLDEVDAIFPKGRSSGDSGKEDLRGLLNAGYRSTGMAMRINMRSTDQIERFSAFCPKALAGIGDLPDTIADRCMVIALQRKPRSVVVERFRRRIVQDEASELAARIAAVTEELTDVLHGMHPQLPPELNDREQDTWELLFALADRAGFGWAGAAREAALDLAVDAKDNTESYGQELLRDLRNVWADDEPRLSSEDICRRLCALTEARWGDFFGREFTQRDLAKTLKPYGVRSKDVRTPAGRVRKGYYRDDLWPVWDRYLSATSATSAASQATQGISRGYMSAAEGLRSGHVADVSPRDIPYPTRDVALAADVAPPPEDEPPDLYEEATAW